VMGYQRSVKASSFVKGLMSRLTFRSRWIGQNHQLTI
jgi:hypothetical protein